MTTTKPILPALAPPRTPEELLADPWAFGPICYQIGPVIPLLDPIPVRGMLGLFPLPFAVTEGIFEAIGFPSITRGLTLQQPYATAIVGFFDEVDQQWVEGPKRIENRPKGSRWRIPAEGWWIAIHAGLKDYPLGGKAVEAWRTAGPSQVGGPLWARCPELSAMPRGAIVGIARFEHVLAYPVDARIAS